MRTKLITSLLVLCLAISIGYATAQTDMAASTHNKGIVAMAGTGNGTVTLGSMERNITGNLLIVKDIDNMTEKIYINGYRTDTGAPVVISAERPLPPLPITQNEDMTKMNETRGKLIKFAFILANFDCNMTNLKVDSIMPGGMDNNNMIVNGVIDFKLSGDNMGIFGKAINIDYMLNTDQCVITDRADVILDVPPQFGMAGMKTGMERQGEMATGM